MTKFKIEAIIEMSDTEISCQEEVEWWTELLLGTDKEADNALNLHSNNIGDWVGESFTITKVEVIE